MEKLRHDISVSDFLIKSLEQHMDSVWGFSKSKEKHEVRFFLIFDSIKKSGIIVQYWYAENFTEKWMIVTREDNTTKTMAQRN